MKNDTSLEEYKAINYTIQIVVSFTAVAVAFFLVLFN